MDTRWAPFQWSAGQYISTSLREDTGTPCKSMGATYKQQWTKTTWQSGIKRAWATTHGGQNNQHFSTSREPNKRASRPHRLTTCQGKVDRSECDRVYLQGRLPPLAESTCLPFSTSFPFSKVSCQASNRIRGPPRAMGASWRYLTGHWWPFRPPVWNTNSQPACSITANLLLLLPGTRTALALGPRLVCSIHDERPSVATYG